MFVFVILLTEDHFSGWHYNTKKGNIEAGFRIHDEASLGFIQVDKAIDYVRNQDVYYA